MQISNYEKQYMSILKNIYENGFSDGINERTGVTTKRLPGVVMTLDVGKEFPILHSKKVAGKTAQREIEWIWKDMSNNINDLKAHIWDQWADKNGSIGKSYGNQINQPVCIYTDPLNRCPENFRAYENQRDFVRYYLKEFPNGRQCTTTIWNPSQLCQRSGDFPVGVPFNTTQYAELMYMFAYELGVEPGILTHVIADAHIYDRQMNGVELQLRYYDMMEKVVDMAVTKDQLTEIAKEIYNDKDKYPDDVIPEPKDLVDAVFKALADPFPEFIIHSDNRDMMSYRADDCEITNYRYVAEVSFGEIVK